MSFRESSLLQTLRALTERGGDALFKAVEASAAQSRSQDQAFAAMTEAMEETARAARLELIALGIDEPSIDECVAEVSARALMLLHLRLQKTGGDLATLLPRGSA